MDLEGTGLKETRPKITEFAFIAVHCDSLDCSETSDLPRVMDELVMCVYPEKPLTINASQMTGKILCFG